MKFVVHYGSSTIRTNQMRVDLSEFQFMELELTAPKTWTVSQLKDWLKITFRLNPEAYIVGVCALWTKSKSHIFHGI
jgi:hypothetical protein